MEYYTYNIQQIVNVKDIPEMKKINKYDLL